MEAKPQWYNMPLPSGWEAKYDPTQKKFFFINHVTKTTSWDDPRIAVYQEQQKQQAQRHQPPTQSQPQSWQQASPFRQQRENRGHDNIAMNDLKGWRKDEPSHGVTPDPEKVRKLCQMFPTATESQVKDLLSLRNNVEGLTIVDLEKGGHERKVGNAQALMLMKLHQEFPDADKDAIKGFIRSADGDEAAVRLQLQEMGFASKTSAPAPRHHSPVRVSSPKPSKPSISEQQKEQLLKKLKSEFPEASSFVVSAALDSCDHNESTARSILKSSYSAPSQSASSAHTATTSSGYTPYTPSQTVTTTEATEGNIGVFFPDIFSEVKPAAKPISNLREIARSSPSPPHTSTSTPSPPPQKPAAKPKSSTKKKKSVKTKTSPKKSPAKVMNYRSENRMQATGPNRALARGADKNLLIDNYVHETGPCASNRKGADPLNHKGSSRASGPDRSLHTGPNHSLLCGVRSHRLTLELTAF